jgi:predicted nucleic acid-binding protein
MSFLLDTNVVSELRKPNANVNVRRWFASVDDRDIFISVLVVGEIRQGIERLRRRDPRQADVYDSWLTALRQQYEDRILSLTTDIAEEWGRLNVPDPLPAIDGLMAATAKVRGLAFATRNIDALARSGARLVDPFADGATR